MEHVFENFLILKILYRHPNITRYTIVKNMRKMGFPINFNTFYYIFRNLEKKCLVNGCKVKVPTKLVKKGKMVKRTKEVTLYSLTDKGYKELFMLEAKMKIATSLSIHGKSVL